MIKSDSRFPYQSIRHAVVTRNLRLSKQRNKVHLSHLLLEVTRNAYPPRTNGDANPRRTTVGQTHNLLSQWEPSVHSSSKTNSTWHGTLIRHWNLLAADLAQTDRRSLSEGSLFCKKRIIYKNHKELCYMILEDIKSYSKAFIMQCQFKAWRIQW